MLTLHAQADQPLDAARGRLAAPHRDAPVLPALAASALAAAMALTLAAAVILGPPAAGPLAALWSR